MTRRFHNLAAGPKEPRQARAAVLSGAHFAGGSSQSRSSQSRRSHEQRGRLAEIAAAGLLMLKGYRILARRHTASGAEIDLIAVRGRRLAFVEVKLRRSLDEARIAIAGGQSARMANAAERWMWRNPRYRGHEMGLDAILLAPGAWPRHIRGALQDW